MSSPSADTILPTPAGQASALTDNFSTASHITIANIICLLLTSVAVVLRVYTRYFIVGIVGADDYLLLIATFFAIITSIDIQAATRYGLGRHAWDVPASDYSPHLLKFFVAGIVLYITSILFLKLSFLFLYRRLFGSTTNAAWRLSWWILLFIILSYNVACILVGIFSCVPMESAWDIYTIPGSCINRAMFYLVNACLNLVNDLAILALPIPVIWAAALRSRQKVMLYILFGTGSFACIISIVRIKSAVDYLRYGDSDVTKWLVPISMWSVVELHCGIICACVATLKPFVQRHLTGFLDSASHNSSNNATVYSLKQSISAPRPFSSRSSIWNRDVSELPNLPEPPKAKSRLSDESGVNDDGEVPRRTVIRRSSTLEPTGLFVDCKGPGLDGKEIVWGEEASASSDDEDYTFDNYRRTRSKTGPAIHAHEAYVMNVL